MTVQRNWISSPSFSSAGRFLLRGAAEAALALGLIAWNGAVTLPPVLPARTRTPIARPDAAAAEEILHAVELTAEGSFFDGGTAPAARDAHRGAIIDIWI